MKFKPPMLEKYEFDPESRSAIEEIIAKAVDDSSFEDLSDYFDSRAKSRNLEIVERDIRAGIELFPQSLDLYAHLWLCLHRQGRTNEALAEALVFTEDYPEDPKIWISYAFLFVGLSRHAIEDKKHLLESIYRMDLSSAQIDSLNQLGAELDRPPPLIDVRSPMVKVIDNVGARVLDWLFGPK